MRYTLIQAVVEDMVMLEVVGVVWGTGLESVTRLGVNLELEVGAAKVKIFFCEIIFMFFTITCWILTSFHVAIIYRYGGISTQQGNKEVGG